MSAEPHCYVNHSRPGRAARKARTPEERLAWSILAGSRGARHPKMRKPGRNPGVGGSRREVQRMLKRLSEEWVVR